MAKFVEMKSLRNFTLKCPDGYCVKFEAKVPKMIRAQNVQDAMREGCAPTDEDDLPAEAHSRGAATDYTGEIRASVLYLGSKSIAERNDPTEFSGIAPKAAVMSEEVGFKVAAKEVATAFNEYLRISRSDEEPVLHPNAERIIMVHKAKNISELQELAELFEFPHDDYKSLGSGDLRGYLSEQLGAGL